MSTEPFAQLRQWAKVFSELGMSQARDVLVLLDRYDRQNELIDALTDRCHRQSELLGKRAEKQENTTDAF